jgi:ribonuclease BN (tRNA processing enzyme)
MGKLKCFGTGPGKSDGRRAYSAYFYQFKTAGVMVDCGEPLSLSFKKARANAESIDALLISHTHPDHIGGFLTFMQMLKHAERQTPLDIFLPGHAIPALKQLMDAAYVFPERLTYSYEMQALEVGRAFKIRGLKVTPFATTHLEKARAKSTARRPIPFQAFSFMFEDQNSARVAHTGDIGSANDLDPLLKHPLQLLVCEAAHATPDELLQKLKPASVRRTALVHLKNADWRKRTAIASRGTKVLGHGCLLLPADGDTIRF